MGAAVSLHLTFEGPCTALAFFPETRWTSPSSVMVQRPWGTFLSLCSEASLTRHRGMQCDYAWGLLEGSQP